MTVFIFLTLIDQNNFAQDTNSGNDANIVRAPNNFINWACNINKITLLTKNALKEGV